MNKEEQEAIDYLKDFDYLMLDLNENYEIISKSVEILLNYISKLQKENEELKRIINKEHELNLDKRYVKLNFVSKDKIKDLLKEYEDSGYYETEKVLKDLLKE